MKMTKILLAFTVVVTGITSAATGTWDTNTVTTTTAITAPPTAAGVLLSNALTTADTVATTSNGVLLTPSVLTNLGLNSVHSIYHTAYQTAFAGASGVSSVAAAQALIDATNIAEAPQTITGLPASPSATQASAFSYSPDWTTYFSGTGTLAISASPLPAGISFTGGAFGGTPSSDGTTTVVVTATDSVGQSVSSSFDITVAPDAATVALNALNACAIANSCASITISDLTTAGVTTASAHGIYLSDYRTALAGASGVGSLSALQSLINTANTGAVPTVQTAPVAQSAVTGTAFTYTPSASTFDGASALTYTASGLPTGITYSGGTFSGTPSSSGNSTVTLTATDTAGGSTSTSFSIAVLTPETVALNTLNACAVANNCASITISDLTTAGVTTASAHSLYLSDYRTALASASGVGSLSALQSLINTANTGAAPTVQTAPAAQSAVNGTAFSYTPSTSTFNGSGALTYTASGMPAGISYSGGTFSGTPSSSGNSTVTLTATDTAGGSTSTSFSINVSAIPLGVCIYVGDVTVSVVKPYCSNNGATLLSKNEVNSQHSASCSSNSSHYTFAGWVSGQADHLSNRRNSSGSWQALSGGSADYWVICK